MPAGAELTGRFATQPAVKALAAVLLAAAAATHPVVRERRWLVGGRHYQRTATQWLARQDAAGASVLGVLAAAYGEHAGLWFQRWRMFWMACAELFGHAGGQEWLVAHYRFVRDARGAA